jgi:feruloyl esterase
MKFPSFTIGILPTVLSVNAAPGSKDPCLSLVHESRSSLLIHDTTLMSSVHVPIGAMIISGTANKVAFCQVVGSVAYGGNETLNFELWLPDISIYEGRFMAVGRYIVELNN